MILKKIHWKKHEIYYEIDIFNRILKPAIGGVFESAVFFRFLFFSCWICFASRKMRVWQRISLLLPMKYILLLLEGLTINPIVC